MFSLFDATKHKKETVHFHAEKQGNAMCTQKTNMDTKNSHIWKEIQFKHHHFWYGR